MGKGKKIGLMGGTFDPIHFAHLALADCAYESLSLDEVWFLPAGTPYLDKHSSVTEGAMRAEMVRIAIQDRENYHVNTLEMERQGNTYTVDTLRILKREQPEAEFYFLIGSDQLYALERWHEPEAVLKLCRIAAVSRDCPEMERSFSEQAEYLSRKYQTKIHLLDFPELDISSTEIREHIRKGKDVSKWVPEPVLRYIREKELYRMRES